MNIETDLVKKKEFSTSINSGIQKHSQEYKVLAILRYLYPQKFSQIAITSWTPRGKNLGHGWSRRIYP